MKILEALQIIASKSSIHEAGFNKAKQSEKGLNDFVSVMLQQYYETEGNRVHLIEIYGEEVMNCLVSYAKMIDSLPGIKLMNDLLSES